jgi:glycosyltransferase involved in cell wall biosynthesis
LADRVDFIGPALGAEKWRLYRQAAVFVLPSYSENLANTVLEAMAMECPVVVTPEVGLADVVVSHRTGVVSSGEPTALANAIRGVLDSPAEALVMGRNGRALVEARYSWSDIAAAMESAYCEIVGGNPESRRA